MEWAPRLAQLSQIRTAAIEARRAANEGGDFPSAWPPVDAGAMLDALDAPLRITIHNVRTKREVLSVSTTLGWVWASGSASAIEATTKGGAQLKVYCSSITLGELLVLPSGDLSGGRVAGAALAQTPFELYDQGALRLHAAGALSTRSVNARRANSGVPLLPSLPPHAPDKDGSDEIDPAEMEDHLRTTLAAFVTVEGEHAAPMVHFETNTVVELAMSEEVRADPSGPRAIATIAKHVQQMIFQAADLDRGSSVSSDEFLRWYVPRHAKCTAAWASASVIVPQHVWTALSAAIVSDEKSS